MKKARNTPRNEFSKLLKKDVNTVISETIPNASEDVVRHYQVIFRKTIDDYLSQEWGEISESPINREAARIGVKNSARRIIERDKRRKETEKTIGDGSEFDLLDFYHDALEIGTSTPEKLETALTEFVDTINTVVEIAAEKVYRAARTKLPHLRHFGSPRYNTRVAHATKYEQDLRTLARGVEGLFPDAVNGGDEYEEFMEMLDGLDMMLKRSLLNNGFGVVPHG